MLLRELRNLRKLCCTFRLLGELLTAKCIGLSLLIVYSTYSIKWTLSRVPKLRSYIFLYNEPLFSGHLY